MAIFFLFCFLCKPLKWSGTSGRSQITRNESVFGLDSICLSPKFRNPCIGSDPRCRSRSFRPIWTFPVRQMALPAKISPLHPSADLSSLSFSGPYYKKDFVKFKCQVICMMPVKIPMADWSELVLLTLAIMRTWIRIPARRVSWMERPCLESLTPTGVPSSRMSKSIQALFSVFEK